MEPKIKSLDLCITNNCNYRCAHCSLSSGSINVKEMSLQKIKEILKDAHLLGAKKLDISGGEPLLRKDLFEIINFGKKLGFKIKILTNGYLLSYKNLKRLKKLGLDAIGISLDGSTHNIYNKIRRKNNVIFNKVISNIKKSVAFGFYTKINTVVFNSNLKDIVNITKLCDNLRVDELRICYFIPFGRGSNIKNEFVNPVDWLYLVRYQLANLKLRIKIFFGAVIIEKNKFKNKHSCLVYYLNHLHIMSNGEVYPCPILSMYKKILRPLGNVNHTPLFKILSNKISLTKYKKEISKFFKTHNSCLSSCLSFSNSEFRFICPYKKFLVEDLK